MGGVAPRDLRWGECDGEFRSAGIFDWERAIGIWDERRYRCLVEESL